MSDPNTQLLLSYLGLTNSPSTPQNVVFISLDFEAPQNITADPPIPEPKTQLGIAILDNRDLLSLSPIPIKTHNFATGPPEGSKFFLFGETQSINMKDMRDTLETMIPEGREVVLVGHSMKADLAVLSRLGSGLEQRARAVLDTRSIAWEVFDQPKPSSLIQLLRALGVRCGELHCAGNDAYFTLRALLALAVKVVEESSLAIKGEKSNVEISTGRMEMLQRLRAIAYAEVEALNRKRPEHMEGMPERPPGPGEKMEKSNGWYVRRQSKKKERVLSEGSVRRKREERNAKRREGGEVLDGLDGFGEID